MRRFLVINSDGLGFNINFNGLILEMLHENAHNIKGYYCLKQPDFDINGRPCHGNVCMDASNIFEIKE